MAACNTGLVHFNVTKVLSIMMRVAFEFNGLWVWPISAFGSGVLCLNHMASQILKFVIGWRLANFILEFWVFHLKNFHVFRFLKLFKSS